MILERVMKVKYGWILRYASGLGVGDHYFKEVFAFDPEHNYILEVDE